MPFSSATDFDDALASVRTSFAHGKTKDKKWRKRQLQQAWWMVEDNKERMQEALHKDLNKHAQEALPFEVAGCQADILNTLEHLDEWTRDEKPERASPLNFLGGATVRKEPKGVALIIGAWNFPFTLLLGPLFDAIAAGCAVIVKPSDVATASQDLLMEIIPKYLDSDAIRSVAKFITAAAAKHLTPVTLELGGQGPAIVCPSADIELSAKRIAATKFMNAGQKGTKCVGFNQICLNVNHVFVHPSVRREFVDHLKKYFDLFLGGDRETLPAYYTHIINERNFNRLERMLQNTSGNVVYSGQRNREDLSFGPTIVTDIEVGDSLLSEELFGPILPIIEADLDTAISVINSMEHPLAIYGFSQQQKDKDRILAETLSGGVTFNDCMLHVAAKGAPFGGVGQSGMGKYHGPYGFLEFTHLRTHLDPPTWMERLMAARYPPYTSDKLRKLYRPAKAPFDRQGNKVRRTRGWLYVLALAVAGSVAARTGIFNALLNSGLLAR
ncbi:aldehyde dehydrogenase [Aspergillus bombycis]|uniref:Aldehyde dehydrogenase n=1 Tax=Aspergillus bombycis TaxID=109264 RepID=A0A1F8A314_9EURO|nr:aldehyde dehydrogenase [Aspergillus bombycis]OGM46104.1 aldehyde dehydrogenase [Aspergillus bombycis]